MFFLSMNSLISREQCQQFARRFLFDLRAIIACFPILSELFARIRFTQVKSRDVLSFK